MTLEVSAAAAGRRVPCAHGCRRRRPRRRQHVRPLCEVEPGVVLVPSVMVMVAVAAASTPQEYPGCILARSDARHRRCQTLGHGCGAPAPGMMGMEASKRSSMVGVRVAAGSDYNEYT